MPELSCNLAGAEIDHHLPGPLTWPDLVRRAGFSDIRWWHAITSAGEELEAMSRCPGREFCPETPPDDLAMVEGKAESLKFTARA